MGHKKPRAEKKVSTAHGPSRPIPHWRIVRLDSAGDGWCAALRDTGLMTDLPMAGCAGWVD